MKLLLFNVATNLGKKKIYALEQNFFALLKRRIINIS